MELREAAASPATNRVLVVEDEYFLADDMARALRKIGVEVVGPVGTRAQALDLLISGEQLAGAVLDINLRGENVFRSRMRFGHEGCRSCSQPVTRRRASPRSTATSPVGRSRSTRMTSQ
jgi:CheY-like chemotaxis protein